MSSLRLQLFGPFQVWRDGTLITDFRSDKVRALLAYLVIERERAVTRTELIALLWPGYASQSARSSLRVALSNLRQILDGLALLHVTRSALQFLGTSQTVWCDVWLEEEMTEERPFLESLAELDSEPFQQWRLATMARLQPKRPLPPHNLPRQLTPLIGRQAELAALSALLAQTDYALISLTGLGGIGKTRLAVGLGHQTLPHWSGGVWFVALEGTRLPPLGDAALDALALTIGQALGIHFQGSERTWRQLLQALRYEPRWQQGKWLLVLDNVEHLMAQVREAVTLLLPELPLLQIVITSRQRLGLRAERVYPLAGLPVPTQPAGDLTTFASLALFLECVRRSGYALDNTVVELTAVAEICRTLEGVPLAIELAAALVAYQPVTTLATALSGQVREMDTAVLDTLQTEFHDMPTRQRSMRAVLDYSWRLLSVKEQSVLALCAVFQGGWTEKAAQAIIGEAAPLLSRLVAHSLLRQDENGRYEMHPLIHAFAHEKLTALPDIQHHIHQAHAAHFLHIPIKPGQNDGEPELMAYLATEQDNLVAAWCWASEQQAIELLAANWYGVYTFFEWHGRYQAYILLIAETLDLIKEVPTKAATFLRAWLHLIVARFSRTLGQLRAIETHISAAESLLAAQSNGEEAAQIRALLILEKGKQCYGQDLATAVSLFKQSLHQYRQINDLYNQAVVLNWLAFALKELGQSEKATPLLQEAWEMQNQIGDKRGLAGTMAIQALVQQSSGHLNEAIALGTQSVALRREIGHMGELALGLRSLGKFYSQARLYPKAIETYQESEALARAQANHIVLYDALFGMGRAHYYLAHYEKAANYLQEAISLIAVQSQASIPDIEADAHGYLALTQLALGKIAAAAEAKAICLAAAAQAESSSLATWQERLAAIF